MRILLTIAAAVALSAVAEGTVVVRRGVADGRAVVLPAAASVSQRYAASELTNYLAKTTGVALPVVFDSEEKPAKAILLGFTRYTAAALGEMPDLAALGTDGFRLKACGDDLVILGSDVRGTLYGVYEVLERFAGCRWYSSWTEVTPRRETVEVPDGLDEVQRPAFPHREPFWFDMFNGDFAARNKANGPAMKLEDRHGGPVARFGKSLGSCHTFALLLPSSRYGAEHPEYYALRKGVRLSRCEGGDQHATQPCLTNPDVLRIVTTNFLWYVRRDPTATYYGLSQNDNCNFCECDRCRAVDEAEGSHAGTMVRFVNAVAEAVEREFPDKIVETLAYRYTRKPPKLTKLRHNVMPCLCSIECDFSRPLPESPYPPNVSFLEDIRGWAAQAKRLYVWDYVTDFHYYPQPMANVYALQGNIRFFRDQGVTAMFTQGDRQGSHAGFAELKAWLLAKWMWNPELPMKPLLDDFFAGYYGKGAPYVREFFEDLHRAQLAYSSASADRPLECEPHLLAPGVTTDVFDRGDRLIARAMEAVKGDPARELNVRTIRFSVDFVRIERLLKTYRELVLAQSGADEIAAQAEVRKLAARCVGFFDERKTIRICSSLPRHDRTVARWRRIAAKGDLGVRTDGVIEDCDFLLAGVGKWTDRVKDPLAEDSWAVRNYNVRPGWSTTLPMEWIAFAPGKRNRVEVRVRLESRVPGRDGTAFTAGIYDPTVKKSLVSTAVRASEMQDGYAWYDLGTMGSPGDGSYFYFAAGRPGPDGKPVAGHVLIDRLRFTPCVDSFTSQKENTK